MNDFFFWNAKEAKNEENKFSTKIVTNKRRNSVQKLTNNTKTLELENVGKYLYKTKRKCEHREEKWKRRNTVNINRDCDNLFYGTHNLRQ